jgi:hypothetical protein
VSTQCIFGHKLDGNLPRQLGIDATSDIDLCQFLFLGFWNFRKLAPLAREIGLLSIGLARITATMWTKIKVSATLAKISCHSSIASPVSSVNMPGKRSCLLITAIDDETGDYGCCQEYEQQHHHVSTAGAMAEMALATPK